MSSQNADADHFIAPFVYQGSLQDANAQIWQLLTTLPRTTVVEQDLTYLHAECTSLIFRFIDDLEFVFDDTQKVIHVRSASRVGYADLGTNRRRVETLRQRFSRHA